MVVDVHAVVRVDALGADNLAVSLQGVQLEELGGGQQLESNKSE